MKKSKCASMHHLRGDRSVSEKISGATVDSSSGEDASLELQEDRKLMM
jgi:hypothetical protein